MIPNEEWFRTHHIEQAIVHLNSLDAMTRDEVLARYAEGDTQHEVILDRVRLDLGGDL